MKYFRYIILILLLWTISCECPPSADTPKKLTPQNYANICILNAVHNTYSINIDTKYGEIINNLLFKSNSQYEKIGSGYNYINIKHNIFDFYKVSVQLDLNSYYTFIPSGNADQVQATLIKDYVEILNKSKSYIRIINSMPYLPELEIHNELLPKKIFKYRDYTSLIESPSVAQLFKIYIENNMLLNIEIIPQAGYFYTIVPFYNPTEKNIYGLACTIIELKIP